MTARDDYPHLAVIADAHVGRMTGLSAEAIHALREIDALRAEAKWIKGEAVRAMTLSLAAYESALLCEIGLDAWDDVLSTLAHLRLDYPDEFARTIRTLTTSIHQETP